MPRQRRALDADRELANAGEDGQLAQVGGRFLGQVAGEHLMKALEEEFRLAARLAFEGLGHDRGGRRRNRATGALKTNILHDVAVHLQVNREPVAAQRVVTFDMAGVRLGAEIARGLAVVLDEVLIEFVQVRH